MNTLFIYMVKSAVYLTAFYLVYSIMLSRDTSYARNRVYILLSLASSFIFPFFTLQSFRPMDLLFFGKFLSDVFVTGTSDGTTILKSGSSSEGLLLLINSIYIMGVIIFVLKLLTELLNLLFLISKQKKKGSRIVRFHAFNTSGFSAMGYIFINKRLNPEVTGEIIKHEQKHIKLNHFTDIIFIELIKAFQWFNPFIYLFNRSLRAIHEFQADKECLSSGVPVVNYQNLLFSQVFNSRAFNLTNSFSNPSLIRKRMIMMTKKQTSDLAAIKLVILIPVIGFVFLIISAFRESNNSYSNQTDIITNQQLSVSDPSSMAMPPPPPPPPPPPAEGIEIKTEESKETPYVVAEEMPAFPGGDAALLKYIAGNTQYPSAAKKKNIQGKVIIRFCVTADGGVSNVNVIKGVAPDLDQEAMRVIKTLPAFKPGKQGGKAVPVWFIAPITFTLK